MQTTHEWLTTPHDASNPNCQCFICQPAPEVRSPRTFTCDKCRREIPAIKNQDGYLIRRIHTVRQGHVIRQLCDRCYQRFEQGV